MRGQIYEHLEQGMKATSQRPEKWDRDRIKHALMICMFAKTYIVKMNPLYWLIETEFPAIAEYMITAKRNDHRQLARACQKMESKIMIDGVAAEMLRRHPTSPILTIHDEIIVPAGKLDELRAILKSEFFSYGVSPAINEVHFDRTAS